VTWAPRRIVTGHDPEGRSVVLTDGAPPVRREVPDAGVSFFELWNTNEIPAVVTADEPEPTERPLRVPPMPNGTVIRVNEFRPGFLSPEGRQSPVHRTETIDYGIVLEGEMVLILDDEEVELRAGDVVVQRGTDHAWANRSDRVARMVFVLVDGRFAPELAEVLGPEALDRTAHAADPGATQSAR
jgi:mannose-6-phosphate isomerase-like protein (cupin superfamily)